MKLKQLIETPLKDFKQLSDYVLKEIKDNSFIKKLKQYFDNIDIDVYCF